MEAQPCKNCGFTGEGKYCSACGQAYNTQRITLEHILQEVAHTFTHADHGFLFTLKELLIHPGTMQKKYLAGERKEYQKPFSMFLLCASITAIAMYLIFQSATKEREVFYQHYFALVQALSIPLYAFVTWIFFRNENFNYAECLVLLMYSASIVLLITIFTNLLNLVPNHFNTFFLEIPVLSLYIAWTNWNFFDRELRWLVVVKSIIALVINDYLSNTITDFILAHFGSFLIT